ncbi:hypothetical protein H8356DRAFT_1660417 [Neocallimastix lanati (nom. inval.)]|uniref:t-SNARE coiled-coil homology domain-containing protein n=1 Tax=Neocallimastix californiae TaxID=1754190 RepID=A0A1Y2DDA4_9FUNG|nr:hypothetical protein H8356DRAFT_1660417 [Neocallimastix sp. JGI-2020a]ORY57084.1 hypothetical protein LY90DRAFT_701733 [Neocallimastix californiae]|eukprot:ORY57084.1 hypothetical protein LY90DRAFT_701733 [Neocallimastix californiae]
MSRPITRNPYLSDRDALFDGYRTNSSSSQSADPYLIEKQNDEQVLSLSEKMKTLKEVSLLIGAEVRSQNQFLDEMDDDMHSTKSLLGNTMNKLGVMMQTQGGSVMWILIIFILCVLIFVYFYIKK